MRLDLWNTTLMHLCTPTEPTATETCTCICCLRPILRHALHTRTFQWYDDSMHVVVRHCPVLAYCPIYREQVRMLDASRNNQTEYFLCHLCLSVFKKSIREIETDSVSYPSLFISETLQFIQGSAPFSDNKLALLKGIMALMSSVGDTLYHFVRKKEHEVLELVLLFYRRTMQREGWNFLQTRENTCPFQVVSFARWHAAGFPLVLGNGASWRGIRQSFTRNTAEWYFEAVPAAREIFALVFAGPSTEHVALCRCCMDQGLVHQSGQAYDHVCSAGTVGLVCGATDVQVPGSSVVCSDRHRVALKSYRFYLSYAQYFPSCFREECAARFYRWHASWHASCQERLRVGMGRCIAFPLEPFAEALPEKT